MIRKRYYLKIIKLALFASVLNLFYFLVQSNKNIIKKEFDSNLNQNKRINDLNKYNYLFKPNENFCQTKNENELLLIAFVAISPQKFNHRNVIRTTWASNQTENNFRVVFMIGKSSYQEINDKIEKESQLYGDIVQNNFYDSYLNLTIKTLMGFRWISTYCSNAKYALKIDDDVLVNTKNLF